MDVFALHCDTIYRCRPLGEKLERNSGHIDLDKLEKGGAAAQCFAAYIDARGCAEKGVGLYEEYLCDRDWLRNEVAENSSRIAFARNKQEYLTNREKGLVSAVCTLEGCEALEGSLDKLASMERDGVVMMTLTWNYENELAYPHCIGGGLKPFGKEAVALMAELGIAPDVSHLSDQGFWDVLDVCRGKGLPVASHSCARSVQNVSRNLTDEMLKALGNAGGIVGLNFFSLFLNGGEKAYMEDAAKHLLHMADKAGIEAVALGSDYDGMEGALEWRDYGGSQQLTDYLGRYFTAGQLEKITHKNALRILDRGL